MTNYIYRLENAPASFDFVTWLAVCATDAQGEFDVTILPGPKNGFRDDDLPPHDPETRRQFLHNVLIPACTLWPVRNLDILPSEPRDGVSPRYTADAIFQGKPVASLKAPEWAMRYVRSRLPENTVTITLRDAGYHAQRVSRTGEWLKVAEYLKGRGFHPVFLADSFSPVALDWPTFPDAICLPIRTALYEYAEQNLGIANGPMALAYHNARANYIMFRLLSDAPAQSPEYVKRLGWEIGKDLPWAAGPNQHLCWLQDTADTIIREFEQTPRERPSDPSFPACWGSIHLVSKTNVDNSLLLDQVRANLDADIPWIKRRQAEKPVVIVGGGPSLEQTWRNIRERKKRGQIVVALNNTHDFLIERGIVPDYCVMLDAREENRRFLKKPHKSVTYLLASQCHSACFDALKGYSVEMWHAFDVGVLEVLRSHPKWQTTPTCVIPGGNTVGLRAMFLLWEAFLAKTFHLYGFDSSYETEKHAYAQDIPDSGGEITVKDPLGTARMFKCAAWMYRQANDFKDQWERMTADGCRITVHGTGLIPSLWKALELEKQNAAA